ncbi:MAG: tetratricopeptide repeat protein [Candidatus Omnitrophica bacterium]|nr:tetratricopeptide repeat protein [Candidatus Omnitrophota bacterium]MDD5573634.1 tetratricopeptide repeat protein [Candidatus Omnitrophota bacterium]
MSLALRKFVLSLSVLVIVLATTFLFHKTQTFYKLSAAGKNYFDAGRMKDALPYLASAYRMNPSDPHVARTLLLAYRELGMDAQARDILERIWETRPTDVGMAEELADLYYRLSEYGKAAELYHNILGRTKDNARVAKKYLENLLWQKKYEEALPLLVAFTKDHPQDLEAVELLADIYNWTGRHDQAAVCYRTLVAARPDDRSLLLKAADNLRWAGRDEEAIKLYRESLDEEEN